ncbi:MAG: DUF721 domain-containing protein, partial [Nocardiopsis sp. BM-2018]
REQERSVHALLPEALRQRCRLGRISGDGDVVVLTDSPACASRLRFLAPAICQAVTDARGRHPRRLRVRQNSPPPPPQTPTPRRLSKQAGRHLES